MIMYEDDLKCFKLKQYQPFWKIICCLTLVCISRYFCINKIFHLKGNTPTQIKTELDAVYWDSTPSFATVKKWTAEFKCGRTRLVDDEHSGRPTTAPTIENFEKVHQMILDDCQIKVSDIAEAAGISKEHLCHILNEVLGMRKLPAGCVLRLPILNQKHIQMNISYLQSDFCIISSLLMKFGSTTILPIQRNSQNSGL